MAYFRIIIVLIAIYLIAFIGFGCDCGDDDDEDSGSPADDDDTDDDDDNDTPDDDDNDDSGDDDDDDDDDDSVEIVEKVTGGEPGSNGAPIGFGPGGERLVVADSARELILYTVTGAKAVTQTSIMNNGYYPEMKVDSAGNLHVLFIDLTVHSLGIATNVSGQWEKIEPGLTGIDPDDRWYGFDVDDNGNYYICYADMDTFTLILATDVSGAWTIETVDSESGTGDYCDITVDSAGFVHITHRDWGQPDLLYVTNATGSWVTETIEAGEDMGEPVQILTDSNDTLHVAYADGVNRNLNYGSNSGTGWNTETLDSDNISGDFHMALDGNNKAHIVYNQWGAGDMRYGTNATGSWVTENVGDDEFYRHFITVDSSEKTFISAYNSADDELQILTNQTGLWETTILDQGIVEDNDVNLLADQTDFAYLFYSSNETEYFVRFNNSTGSWVSEQIYTENVSWPSATWDSLYNTHLAFSNSDGHLAYTDNYGSPVWITVVVDSGSDNLGREADILVDQDDDIHITHIDKTNNWLKYATNKSGLWVPSVVDAGPVGHYAGSAITSEDVIYIAYTTDGGELRLVDNEEGAWQLNAITPPEDPDAFLRLGVDGDDNLHIIFTNYDDDVITYGTNSTGSWVFENVFTKAENDIGEDSDMAIDQDGTVHIVTAPTDWDSGYFTGVYYITNMSGDWTETLVDPGWRAGDNIQMTLWENWVHLAYTGQDALWYAHFPKGYTGE